MSLSSKINAILIVMAVCFAMAATTLSISLGRTDNSIEHSSRMDVGWTAARGNMDTAEFMIAASDYSRNPTPATQEAMMLRYEILAGRVDIFLSGQFRAWLQTNPAAMALATQLKSQMTAIRTALDGIDTPRSTETLAGLIKRLSGDISVLSGEALQFSAQQTGEDQEALRTLHRHLFLLMLGLLASGAAVILVTNWQNQRIRAAHREQQRVMGRLEYLATHDALTGLANRAFFQQRLDECVKTGSATGGRIAMICLDLDRFKQVNDTLGHCTGDRLLVSVANRLRGTVPPCNNIVISRLGGDEFAILLRDVAGVRELSELAAKLLKAVREPHAVDGHVVTTEASIGLAVWPDHAADGDALLRNADIVLKRTKATAKGTWCIFEPGMGASVRQRYKIENALSHALERGEFELHYQPQVSLSTRAICGVEALLRWKTPSRGMVLPGEFIHIAEETGLIVPIGEWVLRTACRAACAMPDDVSMAVNLSVVQFMRGDIVAAVESALQETGLAPRRLELEITESIMMRHGAKTLETLNRLKALGVKIALDDFGTGYSSLSYLRSYRFDKLKTDHSFIVDIERDTQCMNILYLIVEFGKILGMSVIAEGVETDAQATLLRAAGCHEAQGYLFGKPMPEEILCARFWQEAAPRRLAGA